MKEGQLRLLVRSVLQEWSSFDKPSQEGNSESREIQIGKKILECLYEINPATEGFYAEPEAVQAKKQIEELATELIKMHTSK